MNREQQIRQARLVWSDISWTTPFVIILLVLAFFLYRFALTPDDSAIIPVSTKVIVFQDSEITIYRVNAQGRFYHWGVTKDGRTVTFPR
jgi:hypothetical protein